MRDGLPKDPDHGLHIWLNRFERFSLSECLNRAMEGDVEASHKLLRYLWVTVHLGIVLEKRARVYFDERLANVVIEHEQFRDGYRSKNSDAGRALGLKGPPSGGRPKSNQSARDDKLGRAVARKRGQGVVLQKALDDAAKRYKVSPRTVGRAYSNFKSKMVAEVLSAMKQHTEEKAINTVARKFKTKPTAVKKAWDDFVTESEKFETEEQ